VKYIYFTCVLGHFIILPVHISFTHFTCKILRKWVTLMCRKVPTSSSSNISFNDLWRQSRPKMRTIHVIILLGKKVTKELWRIHIIAMTSFFLLLQFWTLSKNKRHDLNTSSTLKILKKIWRNDGFRFKNRTFEGGFETLPSKWINERWRKSIWMADFGLCDFLLYSNGLS